MTNKTLSDKKQRYEYSDVNEKLVMLEFYSEEDVKEFIQNLNKGFLEDWTNANGKTFTLDEIRNKIKQEAGKDLI